MRLKIGVIKERLAGNLKIEQYKKSLFQNEIMVTSHHLTSIK